MGNLRLHTVILPLANAIRKFTKEIHREMKFNEKNADFIENLSITQNKTAHLAAMQLFDVL